MAYSHPMAKELKELEKAKQNARVNNDINAYKQCEATIEETIRNNPANVTPEEWDKMSIDDQISYVQTKINESTIIHDEDACNYWKANLINLQNKKGTQVNEDKQTVKPYEEYYQKILSAVNHRRTGTNFTDDEKKQIIGEIYYNMGYLVANLNTDEEIMDILLRMTSDLNGDNFEKRIQSQITSDIQEKVAQNKKESTPELTQEETINNRVKDMPSHIEQIKYGLKRLKAEYRDMLDDGRIDDDELTILINRINELTKDTDSLMQTATTQRERQILDSIIIDLEDEKQKMTNLISKAETIARNFR